LFIDEAHHLYKPDERDYGSEAVELLLSNKKRRFNYYFLGKR
jgi:hypothetical protein